MIIQDIKKNIRLSKKSGKPYASITIYLNEYTDGKQNMRPISGFGNKYTWAWKIGDDVEPEITEKDGKYLNFSYRDNEEDARLDVYRLPCTIGFVLELFKNEQFKSMNAPEKQEGETDPDDIPF